MSSALPSAAFVASGWTYAAWVALDLRLLLFLTLLSILGATGTCILFIRRRHPVDLAAAFIVTFSGLLGLLVLIFNTIAHYPVFRIESFFPFP